MTEPMKLPNYWPKLASKVAKATGKPSLYVHNFLKVQLTKIVHFDAINHLRCHRLTIFKDCF